MKKSQQHLKIEETRRTGGAKPHQLNSAIVYHQTCSHFWLSPQTKPFSFSPSKFISTDSFCYRN
jgi:hypothetical protein